MSKRKHPKRPPYSVWSIEKGWDRAPASLFFNKQGQYRYFIPWADRMDPIPPNRTRNRDFDLSVTGGRCAPCRTDETGRVTHIVLVMDPKHGDWKFPGGKLEKGESLLECTSFELEEETGLLVPALKKNFTFLGNFSDRKGYIFGFSITLISIPVEEMERRLKPVGNEGEVTRLFPISILYDDGFLNPPEDSEQPSLFSDHLEAAIRLKEHLAQEQLV